MAGTLIMQRKLSRIVDQGRIRCCNSRVFDSVSDSEIKLDSVEGISNTHTVLCVPLQSSHK